MTDKPAKKAVAKKAPAKKAVASPKKRTDLVTEDTDFVYPHEADPRRALPGGTYLDRVEREKAEVKRAKTEGRKPDLDNPPAAAGTPLVSKAQFLNAGGSYFNNAQDLPVTKQKTVKKD